MRSACGDHAAVSLAERSAAAPNTYSDSHGASPKGRRWVGSGDPTGPDTHSYPRSQPFKAAGLSPKGCPVCGGSGCGADVEVSSPVARGGGERVSATRKCRSSSSRRLCRADSWTGRKTVARVTSPRPSSPPGVSFTHSHRFFSSKGLLFSALRQGKDRRPIQATGCPRHDLQRTSRTQSDNALSLELGPRVTVRCHSG